MIMQIINLHELTKIKAFLLLYLISCFKTYSTNTLYINNVYYLKKIIYFYYKKIDIYLCFIFMPNYSNIKIKLNRPYCKYEDLHLIFTSSTPL